MIKRLPPIIFICSLFVCLSFARAEPFNNIQDNQSRSEIAFIRRDTQGDSLLIMDPATKSEKIIASYLNSRIVGLPLWSPDCKFLILDLIDDKNNKGITRANIEVTTNSENIPTYSSKLAAWFPKWSPDGQKLLFQAFDWSEGLRNTDVYTFDINTGEISNLTQSAEPEYNPVWSPDGQNILFASIRNGHSEIYQMDSDGSNLQLVYADPMHDAFTPIYSPDGKSVIFALSIKEKVTVKLIEEDKSIRDLFSETDGSINYVAWSPDGKYFTISVARPKGNAQFDLIDIKTNTIREFMIGETTSLLLFSWSPDNSQIAFQSNKTGNNEIYTLAINSGVMTQLTHSGQDSLFPSWSPQSCLKN